MAACATAPPPAPSGPAIDPGELALLLDPSAGVPRPGDPELLGRVSRAYGERLLAGDASGAAATAAQVLEVDPELDAARVLRGQAELLAGDATAAWETLAPVAARFPEYAPARLALGLAAERRGDLPMAYASYRGVDLAPARARAELLHERAVEVVRARTVDAVRRGRLEDAKVELARLREWAPADAETLEAWREVAWATGDGGEELAAVKALLATRADDEGLLERRGELELQVGTPAAAIEIFQELVRRHPEQPRFVEQLDLAKFRWRVRNLPAEVSGLLAKPELTRADFAVALYWLLPGVRAGVASSAFIATDVLEHPQRQEIVRVINLQLMDVDPALRQFNPDTRMRRALALRSLLRVLQRATPAPSCVGGLEGNPSPSREVLCAAAAACGMLPEPAECLGDAGLSGAEAADWIRRTLALLPS
jgi:Flp pilus assembly protein TadD